MTKKKLAKISPEIIAYEEQTLLSVKQQLMKYNECLDNLGLALDIDLLWYYQGEDVTFSRIEFSNGYTCAIDIQVRRKEEPKYDLDLKAINYIHPISMYGKSLIRYIFGLPSNFSKVPNKMLQEFLDSAEATINEIVANGYDVVLDETEQKEINREKKKII